MLDVYWVLKELSFLSKENDFLIDYQCEVVIVIGHDSLHQSLIVNQKPMQKTKAILLSGLHKD